MENGKKKWMGIINLFFYIFELIFTIELIIQGQFGKAIKMTSGKSELATEPQMATTSSESNPPTPTLATPMEIGHSNVEDGNKPKEEEIVTKKVVEIDEKKEAEIGQNDEAKNAKKQQRPAEYTEGGKLA